MILVIRNPVDRLLSQITRQWTYSYLDKKTKTSNLFALLREVDLGLSCRLTNYLRMYQIWTKIFDEQSILIEKYDNLAHNPEAFIVRILTFLEANENYEPPKELMARKYNFSSSTSQAEIPPMLKWYLAKEWLPSVKKLDKLIDLDLSDWISEMSAIDSDGKLHFHLIRIFHKLYFSLPYYCAYQLFNVVRRRFLMISLQRTFKHIGD